MQNILNKPVDIGEVYMGKLQDKSMTVNINCLINKIVYAQKDISCFSQQQLKAEVCWPFRGGDEEIRNIREQRPEITTTLNKNLIKIMEGCILEVFIVKYIQSLQAGGS